MRPALLPPIIVSLALAARSYYPLLRLAHCSPTPAAALPAQSLRGAHPPPSSERGCGLAAAP